MSKVNEKYKEAAFSIARQLCRDAIWQGDTCNWLSTYPDPDDAKLFYTRSCDPYFYEGIAGIAFFLVKASSVSDDEIIKKTAKGALHQLVNNKDVGGIGFYTGLTGLAFVMKQTADVFEDNSYQHISKQFLDKLLEINPEQCSMDVAEGIAGAIPVLIQLEKNQSNKTLKDFIHSLADYLLQKRKEHELGWSWHTIDDTEKDLTGFGHGAAGIGHAFTCMYAYTGESKYADVVEKAFAYENNFFQQEQNNWPDFRKRFGGRTETVCSLSWCHGAPGIGMARLYAGKVFNNKLFYDDAVKAVETTRKHNNMETLGNLSLCHGLTGNTELLSEASVLLNDSQLKFEAEDAADKIISNYINRKIPMHGGVGNGAETPGFMTGNAGVGYFLLRMYQPDIFSPVLLPGYKN